MQITERKTQNAKNANRKSQALRSIAPIGSPLAAAISRVHRVGLIPRECFNLPDFGIEAFENLDTA
jgi:hypothetical protein